MKDQEIEALAKKAGGRWDGSRWVFEDADLHPFARSLLAAERERIVRRLREIAEYECGCAEDANLTRENAEQIEREGGPNYKVQRN